MADPWSHCWKCIQWVQQFAKACDLQVQQQCQFLSIGLHCCQEDPCGIACGARGLGGNLILFLLGVDGGGGGGVGGGVVMGVGVGGGLGGEVGGGWQESGPCK